MKHKLFCLMVLPMFATLGLFFFALLATGADVNGAWEKELSAWRSERAQNLQAPEGWLSLVGLDWLKAGDNTFGSASDNMIVLPQTAAPYLGILRLDKDAVELWPPAGGYPNDLQINELRVDGHAPHSSQPILTDMSELPTKIKAGTLSMTVIRRGDKLGLRIWDSQASTRLNFRGLHWYEPDFHYRVQARWTPYLPPKHIALQTIIGTEEDAEVPGVAEFTLDGKTLRLEPTMDDPTDKKLFFILRDETSKTDTYQAARFLYTDLPDHGVGNPGTLVLDFNRAQNPPCAYNTFTTCPLPPKGNVLPISIAAGEKRYHD